MTKLNEIINIESTISGYGNDVDHLSCRCINIIILFSPKKSRCQPSFSRSANNDKDFKTFWLKQFQIFWLSVYLMKILQKCVVQT